jgi:hypothetical protein
MQDNNLVRLGKLQESLKSLMNPELLSKLADLLEAMGNDKNSFLKQFNFWLEKKGKDCRYAEIAKQFFVEEQAEGIAKQIIKLYHDWARYYENKKEI